MGRRLFFPMLLWLFVGGAGWGADPPANANLSPRELLNELRAGGRVLFFRHARTDHDQIDRRPVDLSRCEGQRDLIQEGETQARLIGEYLRMLKIPVAEVLTSPFCRTRKTAELAFGLAIVDPRLADVMGEPAHRRSQGGEELRQMLNLPAPAGGNRVIVGHVSNLKEATNLWVNDEAAAFVFRPAAGDRPELLGRILIDDWAQLEQAGGRMP